MNITFDHNCLIHMENGGPIADKIRTLLANPEHQCFVVNVGASEMQRFGVRPDNYLAFEQFLARLGVADLPRLDPIGIWDVTFLDNCLFCGDKDEALFEAIKAALFPDWAQSIELGTSDERGNLNKLCDALTMWCHISYGNDVFLTTDSNFSKATKLPRLLELGAGQILHPNQT
jgi:hypothetical protein